jgi:outer membrane protein
MKQKIFLGFVLLIFAAANIEAQTSLEKYIHEGIENNIALQQKNISLNKAMYSLKTATSYFFPSVELEGNYTSGKGGRNISFPVGDLLNPVYATLNQLTSSNSFPQLENLKIDFFPYHFYDVKLRTTMPIINTDIIFNRSIQSDEVRYRQYDADLYKRELVKDIKTAYYNYMSAAAAENIYRNALTVAEEGKKVNESLLKNGTGLQVYILRSESEIADVDSKIVDAKQKAKAAKQYFNFLLNKDLQSDADTSYNRELALSGIDTLLSERSDVSSREEIKMLEAGQSMNESVVSMKSHYWVPKVNAFIDLGAQDQIWNYQSNSKYYLFGIQFSVPIFEAFRNSYAEEEAELELKNIKLTLKQTENRIAMGQSIAHDNVIAARQNYFTALKKYETAQTYERLIMKGYKEGINTFIETVDARSQLTQSALLVNISINTTLTALAEYESELGRPN